MGFWRLVMGPYGSQLESLRFECGVLKGQDRANWSIAVNHGFNGRVRERLGWEFP